MKFSPYTLLSQLVLGYLWLIAWWYLWPMEVKEGGPSLEIASVPIAFVLGYFINAISSWGENILFWTWGGKPSERLLDTNRKGKIKLSEDILAALLAEGGNTFEKARAYVKEGSNRIEEFNGSYAFSRGLVFALIGVLVMFFIFDVKNGISGEKSYFLLLVPITLAWIRTKDRGYYLAKEFYQNYYRIKSSN